jgi:hypothetical protein
VDPTGGVITIAASAVAAPTYGPIVVRHSDVLNSVTSNVLSGAVQQFNSMVGAPVATFVSPNFQSLNAYAAPQTWLWLIPTPRGLFNWQAATDEMYEARQPICKSINFADSFDAATCPLASMAHPNVDGASAYAQAILGKIRDYLPEWRAVHDFRALTVSVAPATVDPDVPQTLVVSVSAATGQPLPAGGEVWVGGQRVAYVGQPFQITAPSHIVPSTCSIDPVSRLRICPPAYKAADPVPIEVRAVPGYANSTYALPVNVPPSIVQ